MSAASSENRLYALHDLDESKRNTKAPDLRGWEVVDRNRKRLGKVDDLMADPETGNVRYVQVELDDKLLDESRDTFVKSRGSGRDELVKTGALALIPVGMAYASKEEHRIMADTATRESYATAPRHLRSDKLSSDYEEQVREHYVKKHEVTTPENSSAPQVDSRAEGMSSEPPSRHEKPDKESTKHKAAGTHSGGKLSSQSMRPERLHTSGNTPGAPDSLEAGAVSSGSMGGSIESSTPSSHIGQSRMRRDRGDVSSFYGHDIYNEKRFLKHY